MNNRNSVLVIEKSCWKAELPFHKTKLVVSLFPAVYSICARLS